MQAQFAPERERERPKKQVQSAPPRERERPAARRQGTRDDVWFSERGTPTPIRIDQRSRQSIDINEPRRTPFSRTGRGFDWEEHERQIAWDLRHNALFLRPPTNRVNRSKSAGDDERDSIDVLQNGLIGSPGSPGLNRNQQRHSNPQPFEQPILHRVKTLDEGLSDLGVSDVVSDSPASDRSAEEPTFYTYVKRSNTEESAILDSDDTDYDDDKSFGELMTDCSEQLGRARDFFNSKSSKPNDQAYRFGRILDEQLFHLKVWASEAKLLTVTANESTTDESVNLTRSVLTRLQKRTKELCKSVDGTHAKLEAPSVREEDVDEDAGQDKPSTIPDPTTLVSVQVAQEVKGIQLQIRTLRRLTRSFRESQEDENSKALKAHVTEISKYFGSFEACKTNGVDEGIPADRALAMAREMADGACAIAF